MCSQQYKVPYGDFQKSGYPKIVCFTKENPNLNWMIWGHPMKIHFRKPPYDGDKDGATSDPETNTTDNLRGFDHIRVRSDRLAYLPVSSNMSIGNPL